MKSLNRWEGIGRLGQDIELKYTANNNAVASFSLAVDNSYKDKNGVNQEKTEWVPISMFGKTAEIAHQYLKKGSLVYISGEFNTRKWQDKTGADRYTTSIVVNGFDGKMQMLGSKDDGGEQQGSNQTPQQITPQTTNDSFEDDDIPF
jgi:single-strand DNA-binding protein